MTEIVSILEELSFLLDMTGRDTSVRSQDVLHALDPTLSSTNNFLPRGMTMADDWIARNGDPLTNTDAAISLLERTSIDAKLKIIKEETTYKTRVSIGGGDFETSVNNSLPIAIVAATLEAVFEQSKG